MKTVSLDIPHSAEERMRREAESTLRYRVRIVEVLRKYNIALPDAPLDMLALAMKRLAETYDHSNMPVKSQLDTADLDGQ